MNIQNLINRLRFEIHQIFQLFNDWMNEDQVIRNFKRNNESWSIDQILEHVSLTNHYLLLLIRKGTKKALRKSREIVLEEELTGYDFHQPDLEAIGDVQSFKWKSPEHMLPVGDSRDVIVNRFNSQYEQLLDILEQLKNGEGILYKTTMSVYRLGKLDVYQYINFLVLHAKRHIEQMEMVKKKFYSQKR